jgi:hypothetical protein
MRDRDRPNAYADGVSGSLPEAIALNVTPFRIETAGIAFAAVTVRLARDVTAGFTCRRRVSLGCFGRRGRGRRRVIARLGLTDGLLGARDERE